MVGRAGIGVDNIDINAATARGIAVVNAPNGNVRAAAEHTIALLFALSRNIPQAHNLLHEGVWGKNHFMGTEIAGKTLGIIGLGKVGTQVALRARGLGMEVIAHDPFIEQGPDIPLVALDDLLRHADYVTLHVPLTAITAGLIGERELRLMKRKRLPDQLRSGQSGGRNGPLRRLQERADRGRRARRLRQRASDQQPAA